MFDAPKCEMRANMLEVLRPTHQIDGYSAWPCKIKACPCRPTIVGQTGQQSSNIMRSGGAFRFRESRHLRC